MCTGTPSTSRESPRITRDVVSGFHTPRQLSSASTSATQHSPPIARHVDIGINTPRQTSFARNSPKSATVTSVPRTLSNG
jgi:hypothetical protein